jgi:hypothetical protein
LPLSLPANTPPSSQDATGGSPIAGSVLPIARAEELLAGLPGVVSAKIIAGQNGVEEIHVLTTTDVAPKQTVRNIESALIAQLGMRVSHKKISVATSQSAEGLPRTSGGVLRSTVEGAMPPEDAAPKRRLYFEDVEVRRSRTKGVACRVTLREGDQSYSGEAEGLENERLRVDLAARATVVALNSATETLGRSFALEGCRMLEAFDREFVFIGVTTRKGRETQLLTGSAEVRESPETAAVLGVLDATNRCLEFER